MLANPTFVIPRKSEVLQRISKTVARISDTKQRIVDFPRRTLTNMQQPRTVAVTATDRPILDNYTHNLEDARVRNKHKPANLCDRSQCVEVCLCDLPLLTNAMSVKLHGIQQVKRTLPSSDLNDVFSSKMFQLSLKIHKLCKYCNIVCKKFVSTASLNWTEFHLYISLKFRRVY